jgi:IclR family mhp operon transcriptional activator
MEKGVPIRSVSRSIAVLQTINKFGSLPMMSIARRSMLPYPTACRIVQTLLHEGLIEQEPTRKHYRPTMLVQSLAYGYRSAGHLSACARPHMSDLTRKVGWPVFVTVRVGAHMMVRDCTHAETSLTYSLCDPGFTVSLLESATGQAYLAQLAPDELDNAIRWGGGADEEETSPQDIAALKAKIAEVREAGYASKTCNNGMPQKSASIAVPILVDGAAEAVLTLIYFHKAMSRATAIERYLCDLNETADAIAQSLADAQDDAPAAHRRSVALKMSDQLASM